MCMCAFSAKHASQVVEKASMIFFDENKLCWHGRFQKSVMSMAFLVVAAVVVLLDFFF